MRGQYIALEEAIIAMRVRDRVYGDGEIVEKLKTRVRVKFDNRNEPVTFDKANIKICLVEI